MTVLPLDPVSNASPEALTGFLAECRDMAVQSGRPVLVSITIQVESLDPRKLLEALKKLNPDEVAAIEEHEERLNKKQK